LIKETLSVGKVKNSILSSLLLKYKTDDKRLIIGPQIGEDAAAIEMGDMVLVVSTDPITFATDRIGYYTVVINMNDVVTMGAIPKWFSITLLLPEKQTNTKLVDSIFSDVYITCKNYNIALIGGHSEITYGLDRVITVGQMIGEVKREKLISSSGAKPGDILFLTKVIPIEGVAVIAKEKKDLLLKKGVSLPVIKKASKYIYNPGISVAKEAIIANETAKITSMHDPTEGGISTGLYELASASNVNIIVDIEKIPMLPEAKILCEPFKINPFGLLASGSLLITTSAKNESAIINRFSKEKILITPIGKIVEGDGKVIAITKKGAIPFPKFERDEITKLF